MEARLTDTVALITGSSSGTGAAVARRLAAEGAAVALVARRRDRLDDLAAAIHGDGGTALVVQADVTRRQEAVGAVERTVAQLGRLDIVVNNVGIMPVGSFEDGSADDWRDLVDRNVQGLLHVTHAALLHLVRAANDSPRAVADLVNIGFPAGRAARPGGEARDLSTSAVVAFSEVVRQEMVGQRVRVSVVDPGTVGSEGVRARDDIRQAVTPRTASTEPMRPEDIADAVAHIVTRHAERPSTRSSNGTAGPARTVDPACTVDAALTADAAAKASPATSGNASAQ